MGNTLFAVVITVLLIINYQKWKKLGLTIVYTASDVGVGLFWGLIIFAGLSIVVSLSMYVGVLTRFHSNAIDYIRPGIFNLSCLVFALRQHKRFEIINY